MTIPISDFNSLKIDRNYNAAQNNTEQKINIPKETFVKPPDLKQVGDNFSSPVIMKKPKNESPVVKMFDDLISNDSMDQKMIAISDKPKPRDDSKDSEISKFFNNSLPKGSAYGLLDGDCKIKYRFETDIKKSTFAPVKNDPKEYGKNKDFFYVNGINTTEDEAKKTASTLSSLSGQNVKYLYNETNGAVKDLLEASVERFSDSHFDDVTKKTALCFYDTLSEGRDLKIVSHSQGAAITADALKLCEMMLLNNAESMYKKPDDKIGTYAVGDNTSIKFNTSIYSKPVNDVAKLMNKVEVITMGGAASQDKFPNVKLVEVFNPKDPVPQIAGDDLIKTKMSRKETTIGNVSYSKQSNTPKFVLNLVSYIPLQHFQQGKYYLAKNIVSAGKEFIIDKKNVIDYHKVDDVKDSNSYLNQMNVRSLIYNFGRQDFQK